MLNVRTTHCAVGLLAVMVGMGCSLASGDGEASDSPTLVAEEAHARCAAGAQDRRAISTDPKGCRQIMFVCAPDETPFFDACGCGCAPR